MGYLVGGVSGLLSYTIEIDRVHSPTAIDAMIAVEPVHDLELPTSIVFTPCDFVDFENTQFDLTDEGPTTISIKLTDCSHCTKDEVSLWHEGREYGLYLPSAPVVHAIDAALTGAPDEAVDTIVKYYHGESSRFGKLAAFRNDCRWIVAYQRYVKLVAALSDYSPPFETVEYRNRYDHFAQMIRSNGPHSVESIADLEARVDLYNASPQLSNITVSNVVTLFLADNQDPGARDHVRRLGLEPESYDAEYETPLPAGWIGHIFLTEGFRDSEYFARDRPRLRGSYERQKQIAKEAELGNRGIEWGKLVADAARRALREYRYVGSNMLHWTGDEARTDAAFPPMLHRAAKEMVEETDNTRLHQLAAVGEQISLGHVNRRDRDWESSQAAFERAHELAREDGGFGYTRLVWAELDALAGIAIASDQLHRGQEELDEAIAALDHAITEIGSMDTAYERQREDTLQLLRAKRYEAIGDRARRKGDTSSARNAYDNAIDEYESAEKIRSRRRLESKRDGL